MLGIAPLLPLLAASFLAPAPLPQHCVPVEVILWGDGRHDDTQALNAWLRGADATWAASGQPVGAAIVGHQFRLSAAIYVTGGTGRKLSDFRMMWPERGETVTGGTIAAGADPAQPPVASGVHIVGGDPGEGKAFDLPNPTPAKPDAQASCATS
jgi:hypothetical protein